MNKNESFNNFLDQLHDENPTLIESIKLGFKVWCEGNDMDYDAYLDRRVQEHYGDDDGYEEAMENLESEYGSELGYALVGDEVVKVFERGIGNPEFHPGEEWVDVDDYGHKIGGYNEPSFSGVDDAVVQKTQDGYVVVSYKAYDRKTRKSIEFPVNAKVYDTEQEAEESDVEETEDE